MHKAKSPLQLYNCDQVIGGRCGGNAQVTEEFVKDGKDASSAENCDPNLHQDCPTTPGKSGVQSGKSRMGSSCDPEEGRREEGQTAAFLRKQAIAERKQPEEWMSDTLVKEAVNRLAPLGEGGVNILVQAFESVMLSDCEAQEAKHAPTVVAARSGVDDVTIPQGSTMCGGESGRIADMHSFDKVWAWNDSIAPCYVKDGCQKEQADGVAPLMRSPTSDHDVQEFPRIGDQNTKTTETTPQPKISHFESHKESPDGLMWGGAVHSATQATTKLDDELSSEDGASRSQMSTLTHLTKSQTRVGARNQHDRRNSSQPFKLRTEERGAVKQCNFSKRLEEMWNQEQRLRIPIAQGLPWTTDEPHVLPKPATKGQTRPMEFRLLTHFRALERAEFDQYVAERSIYLELQRQEEERLRQIAEEEEVKRLRREMVPRAQLMPYFDRPFMPRRSSKRLTVPKEPNFHNTQNKRAKCMASRQPSTA